MDGTTTIAAPRSRAALPLLGLTVLLVEDSRYASESVRLLCLRSGARIRRADCLRSARRHLACYRPSVAIVDLGLPDGSGLTLIGDMANVRPRVPALLATSGDDTLADPAIAAGADGFLAKPITGIAAFQHAILRSLPDDMRPMGPPRALPEGAVEPDPVAYAEDLAHAAALIDSGEVAAIPYALQLLASVAASAGDAPLATAARRLEAAGKGQGLARLRAEVAARIAAAPMPDSV